ncbi:uncharacterized protein [Asterias amurensis]|uniref:uncharacterized protein isoform X2 n=1 Tax=Asterias amurensis TaxID=7602 RepID=UPI003AB2C52F
MPLSILDQELQSVSRDIGERYRIFMAEKRRQDAVEPTDGDVKDPDNGGTEGGDVVGATEKGEDDSVTESPADITERDGNVKVTETPADVTDKGGNSMVTETPADFTEISDKVTESSAGSTERGNKVTEKPAEVTEKVGNSRVTETPAVVTEMSDKATESSADSTEKSDIVSVTEKPAIVTEEGDNSMVTEPAGVTENSDSVRVTVSPAGVTENDNSDRITKSPAGVTEKGTNVKVTETPVVEEFNLMAAISGPSSIPECGDVKLEGRALGTNLPSMRFQWSIEPSTDALDQTFASINENGIMDVLSFSGNLLNSGVDYIVTLTLQTDMGNRDATIGISKMDSLVPGLTIEARGLSAGNTVLASQTFYLEAKVTFYSCIPSKTTVYEWSVADGNGQTFWAGFQEQSPKQKIEANRVPVNQEVTFIVKAWREGDANKATSEIKLTVLRSPLVAIIAGGSQRTLGRESRLTLDASGSKDLDAMTYSSGELQYQWECSRPQEDAACYLAGASVTSKTLSVGPGVLSNGMHTFTVTVSKLNAANTNDHREATASVKVDIQSGSPPEAVLTREFNGMFKPQQLIVVTAEIAKKGDTKRVLWAITKGAETQDVHSQAETSFEKNDADDTAIATITLPAGTLTAGSDYEIRAMMIDDGDTELSSAATKITIYREISGCRVSLQSEYLTLSPGQIKVDRCVGSDGLTYQAFVASTNTPAKKIPLMTVPVDSSLLNIEFFWEVEGAEYVNIIVRVCGKEGRCKEFTEESIRQVQRITEAAIQAITDDIQKDKESGDYVQAFHKNSRIMKSRAATSGNRRRRATADGIAEHYSLLTDATSLLGSIGAAERSTISLDLETFPDVQTEDQSMTMLTNLKDLIRSYIGDDPEHLRETFEELSEQIAETHAGLALPADRRELRRHAQNLTRHLGTVLQNLQESISRTELVHSRIRRGRLERAIQFDRVNISFPLSVIFERLGGREVLLHIEDYQSEEVADFDYIQSITVLDVSGVPIPLANLLERINVTFPATQMKSICKYLDENTDSWSMSGVLTIHEAQNEPVICQTNHLTEFALEVSVDPFDLGGGIVPIAGLTVGAVIGIIIGVLALLVIVIIIVFMVMKMSKNKKVNPQE